MYIFLVKEEQLVRRLLKGERDLREGVKYLVGKRKAGCNTHMGNNCIGGIIV